MMIKLLNRELTKNYDCRSTNLHSNANKSEWVRLRISLSMIILFSFCIYIEINGANGDLNFDKSSAFNDKCNDQFVKLPIDISAETIRGFQVKEGYISNHDKIIYKIILQDNAPSEIMAKLAVFRPNRYDRRDDTTLLKSTVCRLKKDNVNEIFIDISDINISNTVLLGELLNSLTLIRSSKVIDNIEFKGPNIDINYKSKFLKSALNPITNNVTSMSVEMIATHTVDISLILMTPTYREQSYEATYDINLYNSKEFNEWTWTDFEIFLGDVPPDWEKRGYKIFMEAF